MLEKMLQNVPMYKVIAIGAGSGVAFTSCVLYFAQATNAREKPHTLSAEWRAATEDYRRYQNMEMMKH